MKARTESVAAIRRPAFPRSESPIPDSMRRLATILCMAMLVFGASCLSAVAVEVPPLTGRVVDRAELLSAAAEGAITRTLTALEASDSTQVAVLTIPALEGEDLEGFSVRVAHEEWHLGQAHKDNGVLLLVVRDDRRIRIEVGYGLEGVLTDLLAGRIIDGVMVPRFKEGDWEGGILAGVEAITRVVRGEFRAQPEGGKGRRVGLVDGLFLVLALFYMLGSTLLGGRRRRYRGITRPYGVGRGYWIGGIGGLGGLGGRGFGGGIGGGFGGGGGGFGGGGASGGW